MSRIGRRDFLKLGVGGSGVVLSGKLPPHPAIAAPKATRAGSDHSWWVREVDEPTVGRDDSVYARFDAEDNVFGSFSKYVGREKLQELRRHRMEKTKRYLKENRPGFRLADRALADAAWVVSNMGGINKGLRSWNRKFATTPEERGVEKFQGSPDEAAALVKAAARYFGAATAGITLLDQRHIYTRYRGKDIAFEDVEEPYEEDNKKLVIPNKCKYAIALSVQMSIDNIQCAPTAISSAGSALGYSRCEFLVGALAEFIRGLGYTAIPSVNDLGSSVAIAVDAGLGEMGRTNRVITPECGPMVRLAKVITDLPMAADKPIDFNVREFCKVCKRCAEACPVKALSFKEEPDYEVCGEWNNPGHEAWFEDAPKCLAYWQESTSGCSVCLAVCPWSKKDKTMMHSMVKAASARMPFLDGFLVSMDETFGYGEQKDPETWWKLDLPEYGIDTTQGKGQK